MKTVEKKKIDVGRIILVPVFAFLIIFHARSIWKHTQPLGTIEIIGWINQGLVIFFYALLIFIYFLRTSARRTTTSLGTNTIAVVASFIPFIFPFMNKPASVTPMLVVIGGLLLVFGLVLSICSLGALGRSFSLIPQVRGLVRSGPYRWVRHPL